MKTLIKLLLNAFALWIVSYLIPGFYFEGTQALVVTAVVVGIVNTFIKPILQIIFIPISIITFGITAILINVVLLWGVSYLVPGFEIDSFWTAVISSIALMLVSLFLNRLSKGKEKD